MIAAMVTVRPELEAIRRLLGADAHQREPGGGHRTRSAGDRQRRTIWPGQEVFVRKASAYYDTLSKLNEQLKARGKPAVVIDEAPDVLEDDDILEMVNAGLAPITVVDDYLAEFWSQVFTGITVHKDVAVRTGGRLAVAFRKDNPKLRECRQRLAPEAPKGRRLSEHHRTPLSPERQVREKRRG